MASIAVDGSVSQFVAVDARFHRELSLLPQDIPALHLTMAGLTGGKSRMADAALQRTVSRGRERPTWLPFEPDEKQTSIDLDDGVQTTPDQQHRFQQNRFLPSRSTGSCHFAPEEPS